MGGVIVVEIYFFFPLSIITFLLNMRAILFFLQTTGGRRRSLRFIPPTTIDPKYLLIIDQLRQGGWKHRPIILLIFYHFMCYSGGQILFALMLQARTSCCNIGTYKAQKKWYQLGRWLGVATARALYFLFGQFQPLNFSQVLCPLHRPYQRPYFDHLTDATTRILYFYVPKRDFTSFSQRKSASIPEFNTFIRSLYEH